MNTLNIPIINYHKIEAEWDIGITTRTPDRFAADMFLLKEMGFQTVTFNDLAHGHSPAHISKPLIITFDDGYESVYTRALPVMRGFGFRGVVYVPTAFIGKENSWDVQFGGKAYRHLDTGQLKDIQAAGFEIGSHGIRHVAFTALSDDTLQKELLESKKYLEDLLGKPVVSICYPFGQFNEAVQSGVKKAGYHYALASLYFFGSDKSATFGLKRMNVYRFDSDTVLKKKTLIKPPGGLLLRDWLIQRGALATVLYQRVTNNNL
ncbi:MAG TPA: polysaccharide deacetylase family protein [Calditrichaeota bacterium]|nr:polysaccharide deacetylase family protein [Calditrichota bacterium]